MALLKAILKNQIFWYLVSKYIVLGLQFIAAIFLAIKLGSFQFGIWSFFVLLVATGSGFNFGVGHSLLILLVQNKENKEKSNNYIINSLFLAACTAIFPILIVLVNLFIPIPVFEKYRIGNFIYAAVAIIALLYLLAPLANVMRVNNKITQLSIQQVFWPLTMVIAVFCATDYKLLVVLVAGYLISSIVSFVFLLMQLNIELKLKINVGMCKELIEKGFYLFLYNTGFALIMLSTKFLISRSYSVEEFGCFSFAFSVALGVMSLVDAINFFISPKLIDVQKSNEPLKIRKSITFLRSNYLLLLHFSLYCIIPVGILFFDMVPKFQFSLVPFFLILHTFYTLINSIGYSSYLLATNKEKLYSLLVIVTLMLNLIFVSLAIVVFKCSFGYVILGTMLSYFIYSCAINCIVLYYLGERRLDIYLRETVFNKLFVFSLFSVSIFLFANNRWILLSLPLLFSLINLKSLKQMTYTMFRIIKCNRLLKI